MNRPQKPLNPTTVQDLSNDEISELDELLEKMGPEALDVIMLDGFLCGVLAQPKFIEPATFMPYVFEPEGGKPAGSLPDDQLDRLYWLVERRYMALNRAMVEDQWFDPIIMALLDEATGEEIQGPASIDAVIPWAAGFQFAAFVFPDLAELPSDDVSLALARLFRFIPLDDESTEEEKVLRAMVEEEAPLRDLDGAIEDVVGTVLELADLGRIEKFKVTQVKRDGGKLGRNDPCHCGSGKKFKACHGKND